jgi:monoamine oxidase
VSGKKIIVVGGGFAGVTAARDLSHLGYQVVLLEARDRLGGRTFIRPFAETDYEIEMGGAWFSGERERFTFREVTRYGLEYKHDPPVYNYAHLLGGERVEASFPVAREDLVDFERGALHILRAALTIDPRVPIDLQPTKSFDITWDDFIDPLNLSPRLRDLFDAWGRQSSGGGGSDAPTSTLTQLALTAAYGHSLVGWATMLDKKLEGGTRALLNAMIGDSNVDVRFGTPVRRIEQDGSRVRVEADDGEAFTAGGAVFATPPNTWLDVEFSPSLSAAKIQGASLRPQVPSVKLWALVEDAPPGFMGYGNLDQGHGVTVLNGQGEIDGAQLLFGLSPIGKAPGVDHFFDPFDRTRVQAAISAFIPGAKVIATDAVDWNVEPYSRGAWGAYKIGQMEHLGGMRVPEGRVAFAGGDIARGSMGINGAIESGTYAAATLDRIVTEGVRTPTASYSG